MPRFAANLTMLFTEEPCLNRCALARGGGCKAIRVEREDQLASAISQAEAWIAEFRVPVVIEVILERVTNIAMGTEIDNINEFEPVALSIEDAPTAVLQA